MENDMIAKSQRS